MSMDYYLVCEETKKCIFIGDDHNLYLDDNEYKNKIQKFLYDHETMPIRVLYESPSYAAIIFGCEEIP